MSKHAIDLVPALLVAAAKGQTMTVAAVVDTFTDDEFFAVNHRVAVCHQTDEGEPVLAAVLAQRANRIDRAAVDA